MVKTEARYEEFGTAPWAGAALALIVACALLGPFAHAHPASATHATAVTGYVAPSAAQATRVYNR
jgi:hypothetical protein